VKLKDAMSIVNESCHWYSQRYWEACR